MNCDLEIKSETAPFLFAQAIAMLGDEAVDGKVHALCWMAPNNKPSTDRLLLICFKGSNSVEFGRYCHEKGRWEWLLDSGIDGWDFVEDCYIRAWMEIPRVPIVEGER